MRLPAIPFVVEMLMKSLTSQYKIGRPVVVPLVVDVVNVLVSRQRPSDLLFHDQAMLIDVSAARTVYQDVPLTITETSHSPHYRNIRY